MQMGPIDRTKYPLFDRMAGGLVQGIGRMVSSEDHLADFLLGFFRRSEMDGLLAELQDIASRNLSNAEWRSYWWRHSKADTCPANAESSHRLLQLVIAAIVERKRVKKARGRPTTSPRHGKPRAEKI
jgi:hypothetical protein